jgi:hypothetical protein
VVLLLNSSPARANYSLKAAFKVSFGVLSIYQPLSAEGRGLVFGFMGFYAHFLESNRNTLALGIHIL